MPFKNLLIIAFIFAVTLQSCKCADALPGATKTTTITEVVRDTIFKIERDNSYYKALLECQNGKVVIKDKPQTTKTKNLKAPKVAIKDNQLTVDCEKKAQELYAQWVEKSKSELIEKPYAVERQLTFWQKLYIFCGKLFLFIVLISIVGLILNLKKTIL